MAFKKGDPRPPNAGRKAGVPNKVTIKFRDRLEHHGVDLEAELAKAILAGNIEMIKALQLLLPYAQPRLKESESDSNPTTPPVSLDASKLTSEEIAALIKTAKEDDKPKPNVDGPIQGTVDEGRPTLPPGTPPS